ncbi:MAG: hypothetical protein ACHWZW_06380 [Spirulina sp.]
MDRVTQLLNWAEGPTGRGAIYEIWHWLDEAQGHRTHSNQNSPYTPPPPPPQPTLRYNTPPAQHEKQIGGWRELLRSTEAIVAIAGIIVGLPAILLVIFDFIKPSAPEFRGFQPDIPIAFVEATQIAEPDSEPRYVGVEGFEAAIDANSIQWEQSYLKVVTVSTEYEALVIYDCQNYRSAELMLGDGIGEMQPVQEPVWNNRDPGFARAVCNTATAN